MLFYCEVNGCTSVSNFGTWCQSSSSHLSTSPHLWLLTLHAVAFSSHTWPNISYRCSSVSLAFLFPTLLSVFNKADSCPAHQQWLLGRRRVNKSFCSGLFLSVKQTHIRSNGHLLSLLNFAFSNTSCLFVRIHSVLGWPLCVCWTS